MTEPLTATERRVYEYLIDFLAEHTYQPSIREIGRQFRIKSTKTVSDVLQGLARKGFIERDPSRSRGVRLVGYTGVGGTQALKYFNGASLPSTTTTTGSLASAGTTSIDPFAPATHSGHLVLDRRLCGSGQSCVVRATSDALRAHGIQAGDYVLVDPDGAPADGGVVAARIGSDVTLRLYARTDDAVVLRGGAGEADVAVQAGGDAVILGVATAIVRSLDGGDPLAHPLVSRTTQQLQ